MGPEAKGGCESVEGSPSRVRGRALAENGFIVG